MRLLHVSYLEKLVSGYWKVYATSIFADTCINSNLLLDLLCSSVLKPCGHGGSNGDRDDVPSGGIIVSGGGGGAGWSHCIRAWLRSHVFLGGHAGFVYCERMECVPAGAKLSGSHVRPADRHSHCQRCLFCHIYLKRVIYKGTTCFKKNIRVLSCRHKLAG